MSSMSEASKSEPDEQVKLLAGLRNPVLRTYLFPADIKSWRRYLLLLASAVGIVLVVVGPLFGTLYLPRCVRQDAIYRQAITPGDECYEAKTYTQECPHWIRIEYNLLNISNLEEFEAGRSPPGVREVGPFVFAAKEVSHKVAFTTDMATVKRSFSFQQEFSEEESCLNCGLDEQVVLLNKEYLRSGGNGGDLTVRTTVRDAVAAIAGGSQQLVYTLDHGTGEEQDLRGLPLNVRSKRLHTGWGDHKKTSHVTEYEGIELSEPYGLDGGEVFGPDFDSGKKQVVFDSWVAQPGSVKSTGSKPKYSGIKCDEMDLDTELLCSDSSNSCLKGSWNVSQRFNTPTIVTLPYFLGAEDTQIHNWLSTPAGAEVENHKWHFYVEPTFGVTLERQTTYQISHFVTRDTQYPELWIPTGSQGIWIPTHWIRVLYKVSPSELDFIKSSLQMLTLGYYICGIAFPVLGACILMKTTHAFLFSKASRVRYKTMQILVRSRARDPKLNPSQYNALKHFMTRQMKKPRRTKRTDEVSGDVQKGKEIPAGKKHKGSSDQGREHVGGSKLQQEGTGSSPGSSRSH